MAENDKSGIHLGFYSKSLKGDTHQMALLGVDGREELARLFAFELLLFRGGEPLDDEQLAALTSDSCVIALGVKKTDLVHGVLSSIEHVGGAPGRGAYYRATLRPYASLLGLGRRSAIYQDTSVVDMVRSIFEAYGLAEGSDFEFAVEGAANSTRREYIVQYKESDWSFIQRWLEHEGLFYWFVHSAGGVKMFVADESAAATPLPAPNKIAYRERNNLAIGDGAETIWSLRARHERVEHSVTLVDYNDERPLDLLIATNPVDEEGGFGHVVHYGDHFADRTEGARRAKLRAEEHYVRRRVVTGQTDCARLRVGHTIELENHPHAPYDGRYLVTSVEHRAGIDAAKVHEDFTDLGAPRSYRATFSAIPIDVPFRPARRTAWPRIDGVLRAHVDADTEGEFAQIDEQGRYKIKFPWDLDVHKGLPSSRWIRMAQAYAGAGYGQHLPQHKGAEVLIAHVEGDPDRPVIVGAVPNPATPSPVVDKNATQSVLQTASGIRLELEDRA